MAAYLSRKVAHEKLTKVEIRLAALRGLESKAIEKRKKAEAVRDALLVLLSALSGPAPSAPVPFSHEKGAPVEWDRAWRALLRVEEKGDPDETHDPVSDLALLNRLDPPFRRELLEKYAARVGPIAGFSAVL